MPATFHHFGHDVTVYERGGHVGGVWAPENRYPGLRLQSTGDFYYFTDLDSVPAQFTEENPDAEHVYGYLLSYAEKHGILPLVQYHTTLVHAQPLYDDLEIIPPRDGSEAAADDAGGAAGKGITDRPPVGWRLTLRRAAAGRGAADGADAAAEPAAAAAAEEDEEFTVSCDVLVACTGTFSDPNIPPYKGVAVTWLTLSCKAVLPKA
ncbi:hypothetical protein GPECTOR_1g601 [Gonium pectorale]|uniref:Flavin-containing monooxygenase n=1 Tax=Gonium pectorale TaxID=33097 RepID=A0A150H4B4_GONPE|nr:hypothetical protein GPECTOR_1g601 [Gonium pectorale]|eukprot:KXZ56668.1 hypothetical protein GPECTOR_1g601 [Gonium pectorale]